MKYIKNDNVTEIDVDENIKTKGVFSPQIPPLSNIPLTFYSGPLTNKDTYKKDLVIIEKYGQSIMNFFKPIGCSSLPFFTTRMEPKCVKRIVVDKSINVPVGYELRMLIKPFTFLCMIHTTGSSSTLVSAPALDPFIYYRVVTAKVLVKQVGILSVADGYGTVIDASIVSPTMDMDFLRDNVLNIQNMPGRSVMGADGRIGIQANFIGSDLYPEIPTAMKVLTEPEITFGGPTLGAPIFIPAGSRYGNITGSSMTFQKKDGTTIDLDAGTFTNATMDIVGSTGPVIYERPYGEALFLRVSPPSVQVSYKIYLDMVVEGQVKQEYATNMPQITPPYCFDFERIRYAVQNVLPAIVIPDVKTNPGMGVLLSPPPMIMQNEQPQSKPKGSKYTSGGTPANPPKISPTDKEDPYLRKMEKLPRSIKNKVLFFKDKMGFTPDDIITYYEKDGQVPQDKQSELTKVLILYDFPDASDEDVNSEDNGKDEFSIAMENEEDMKKVKDLKKYQKREIPKKKENIVFTANPKYKMKGNASQVIKPEIPGYLKEAVEFSGTNLAERYQQTDTNRLFHDATLPTPQVSYQYFPVVGEETKKVSPAIVIVTQDASTEHSVSIKTYDHEGTSKDIEIYYDPDDFADSKQFILDLQIIVSFAYKNNLHYSDTPSLTIRMFAPNKIVGRSYMYALLLAFYGAPSGGYYSGSFDLKEEQYLATDMEREVISLKANSTTLLCPLVVMAKNESDAAFTNIVSGIVPKQEDGKLVTTDNPYIGLIYGLLPFNARLYRETPFKSYSSDIKMYLMKTKSDLYRKYIIVNNLTDTEKITKFLENDEVSWSDFAKSSLPRFSGIAINKKKYMTANDFYEKYPEYLTDDRMWKFRYGNDLFVDRNMFKAHIREAGEKYIKDYEKRVGTEWREKLNKVKDIKTNDYKIALEKLKQGAIDNPFKKLNQELKNAEFKYQQEDDSDETLLWQQIAKMSKPFYNVLDRMANFIAQNKGTRKYSKKISSDSKVGSALDLVSLSNNISPSANIEEEPAIEFFIKVVKELGPNGIQAMAYAANWPHTRNKPNLKITALKAFRDYLKKIIFPEDEMAKERIRYKSENKNKINMKIPKKKYFIPQKDENFNNEINLEDIDINYNSENE